MSLPSIFDSEHNSNRCKQKGGFDEGVLKARFEVSINVTDATEDLDSGDTVLDVHPYLGDTPIGLSLTLGRVWHAQDDAVAFFRGYLIVLV